MKQQKRIISILISIIIFTTIITLIKYEQNDKESTNKNEIENEVKIVENLFLESETKPEIENDILGILEIKKINVKGIVKEGSNSEVLSKYIGHIEESPKYDGNICLAGHNRGNIYPYFSKLNQLVEGDEIIYKNIFGENRYKINNIKKIEETDWSMLQDSEENKITLITCIKNERDKRLCVQAIEM